MISLSIKSDADLKLVIRPTSYIGSAASPTQDPANLQLWLHESSSSRSVLIAQGAVNMLAHELKLYSKNKNKKVNERLAVEQILCDFALQIQDAGCLRSRFEQSTKKRESDIFYQDQSEMVGVPVYKDYGQICEKFSNGRTPGQVLVQTSVNKLSGKELISDIRKPTDFGLESNSSMFECFLKNPGAFTGLIEHYYENNLLRGQQSPGNCEILVARVFTTPMEQAYEDGTCPDLEVLSLLQSEQVETFTDQWSPIYGHDTTQSTPFESFYCDTQAMKRVLTEYQNILSASTETPLSTVVSCSVTEFGSDWFEENEIESAGGLCATIIDHIESANDDAYENQSSQTLPVSLILGGTYRHQAHAPASV